MSKTNIPSDSDFDLWLNKGLNVLLIGEAGVGKTSMVLNCFNRNNLRYFFCSAATMDPWVDFIGIPKERKDEFGNTYLDLIRPKQFAEDNVEAIFIDEFNRAPKKIRNAVMELIQFKSINGKKFNNLKVIWAAINPENSQNPDAAYDVETLDPAQKDRFHIHVNLPYECSEDYFRKKYSDVGCHLVKWWNTLSEKDKFKITPRRLDYIANAAMSDIDIEPFVPEGISASEIIKYIFTSKFSNELRNIYESDEATKKEWISKSNNLKRYIEFIKSDMAYTISAFWNYIPKDYISVILLDKSSHFYRWYICDKKFGDTSIRKLVNNIFTEEELKNRFGIDLTKIDLKTTCDINQALKAINVGTETSQKRMALFESISGDPSWVSHEKYIPLIDAVEDALSRTNRMELTKYESQNSLLGFLYTIKNSKIRATYGNPYSRCRIGIADGFIHWGDDILTDKQVEIMLRKSQKKNKIIN